ncbi:MAG: hypothetical protein IJJ99_07970 [Oscillospiraceae bacterium]|nr:hypothetical protein [Oscillospiraceae bacterium]
MKKLLAMLLAGLMLLSLCACGNTPETKPAEPDSTSAQPATDAKTTDANETHETEAVTEATEEQKPTATEISLNETIALEFVEITFEEYGIAADIKQSISADHVTRISGPQPEDGKQFVYLRGTIKNVNKESLPVYDFFIGEFDIDGFKYECTANQCDVLTSNGEIKSTIEPLTSYSFTIYAKIPDELANNHSGVSFRFGFYDLFDNYELSYNRSFEDDPISLCPYQYALELSE